MTSEQEVDVTVHWHLFKGDYVRGPSGYRDIDRTGIYRIHPDGTIEDWGPVAPEDRCRYCLAELGRAVAP